MRSPEHIETKHALDRLKDQPAQSLIIVGPAGSGKAQTAEWLAREWLGAKSSPLTADKFKVLEPINKQISIEQIRELQSFAKVRQKSGIHRVIVISQADTMAEPAQNALLKLLEEPTPGTAIMLLVQHETSLRPTIRSRCQSVRLLPLSESQLASIHPDLPADEVTKLFRLSAGYRGKFQTLKEGSGDSLITAKDYLASSKFDRVAKSEQYNKDRELALELASNVLTLCRSALTQTLSTSNQTYKQWLSRSEACHEAHERLISNANIKLTLDCLALKLI